MTVGGSGTQAPPATQPWPLLSAPAHWHQIDFISDLHLQASEPATLALWQAYMQATRADAVFILGDLFEVWVGDDAFDLHLPDSTGCAVFESQCAQVLRSATDRLDVFFMHGNRDFLLGSAFAENCGMTLLDDPTILDFGGQRWLLSHGDALCLADTDYMAFRAQIRTLAWQADFLAQPLSQRQATARAMRAGSQSRKRTAQNYVDLDTQQTCAWLQQAKADTLIHGHTHRPSVHTLPQGRRRIVLSDWDGACEPARAEVLRLSLSGAGPIAGVAIERISPAQVAN